MHDSSGTEVASGSLSNVLEMHFLSQKLGAGPSDLCFIKAPGHSDVHSHWRSTEGNRCFSVNISVNPRESCQTGFCFRLLWGQGFCLSNPLPDDGSAVGPQTVHLVHMPISWPIPVWSCRPDVGPRDLNFHKHPGDSETGSLGLTLGESLLQGPRLQTSTPALFSPLLPLSTGPEASI